LLKSFVPTERELRRRRQLYKELAKLRSEPSPSPGPFPSAEEMVREDRDR